VVAVACAFAAAVGIVLLTEERPLEDAPEMRPFEARRDAP